MPVEAPRRGTPWGLILLSAALLAGIGAGGWFVCVKFRLLRPSAKSAPAAPATPAAPDRPSVREHEEEGWGLAAFCPEATVAFVSLRDLPGAVRRARESDLNRILSSPAITALVGAAQALMGSAPATGIPSWILDPGRREAFLRKVLEIGSGEVAFALTEIEKPDGYRGIPHVLVAIRPAEGRAGLLEPLAEHLFGALLASSPGLERRESEHAGVRIRMVGDANVVFSWAVRDGVLLAASHGSTLREALDLGAGRGNALRSSAAFRETCRDAGPKGDLLGYLNVKRVWDWVPPEGRPPEASGLADVDALALGLEIVPPACRERLVLHVAKARSGFLALLENPTLPEAPPGPLPPRVLCYSRASLAVGKSWDEVLKTVQKTLRPSDARVVLGAIDAFNRQMGFRIREDLIESLGGTVTTVTVAVGDPAVPGSVTSWVLDKPARFKDCMDCAMGALDRLEGKPLRRRWVEGIEVFEVDPEGWNSAMPWAWPPGVPGFSFGIVRDGLVMSDRPERIPEWGRPRGDLVESEELRKAWAERPPGSWVFSYADVSEWVASGAWASGLRDLHRGGIRIPGVGPSGDFPAVALSGRISPFVSVVYNTPRSVVMECRGPVPVVTAMAVAVTAAVAMPAILEGGGLLEVPRSPQGAPGSAGTALPPSPIPSLMQAKPSAQSPAAPSEQEELPDLEETLALFRKQARARDKVGYAADLGRIGPAAAEAIPDLVAGFKQMLAEEPGPTSCNLVTAFATALGKIGPAAAEEAVPVLAPYATDDTYSREILFALAGLGPQAVPVLAKAVRWQEPGKRNLPAHIRWDAAEALSRMGPVAEPAIPALLAEILDDEKGYVFAQQCAAHALSNIGAPSVPALLEARKHLYAVSKASGLSVERTAVLRIVNEALAKLNATPGE